MVFEGGGCFRPGCSFPAKRGVFLSFVACVLCLIPFPPPWLRGDAAVVGVASAAVARTWCGFRLGGETVGPI